MRTPTHPVDLVPATDLVPGQGVYQYPLKPREVIAPLGGDLVIRPDGCLVDASSINADEAPVVTRLPKGRMASGEGWDEIARQLQLKENGSHSGTEVVMLPGGRLQIIREDEDEPRPLSKLPQDRMAAATPGPSSDDVETLRLLDPDNVEEWKPVNTGELSGWKFQLTPPNSNQPDFVFFAFRSPSDGNAWRISVLWPDKDHELGHRPHMIKVSVGGVEIPVICGPEGKPARTLDQVRTHAAKWMAYTSRQMAGLDPGFSR